MKSLSFNLETFTSNLEELKGSVAYSETGEICPDLHKVQSALQRLGALIPTLNGKIHFSTADYVSLSESGMNMNEVYMVLEDAYGFLGKLDAKLVELRAAAIHRLHST